MNFPSSSLQPLWRPSRRIFSLLLLLPVMIPVMAVAPLLFAPNLAAQGLTVPKSQRYGTAFIRDNLHNGNKVKVVYRNSGRAGGAWPIEQNSYLANINLFVAIENVFIDTVQVSSAAATQGTRIRDGRTVTVNPAKVIGNITFNGSAAVITADTSIYVTSHENVRGRGSKGPQNNTGEFWGITPYDGFLNPRQNLSAMSHQPNTWPDFWPDKLGDPLYLDPATGRAKWNGYFGASVFNADQESYHVLTDGVDKEWFTNYNVQPDPENPTRYGAGLDISARGLQWANFLAQDVLFLLYEVKNNSVRDYRKVLFGSIAGTNISGSGGNNTQGYSLFDQSSGTTYTFLLPGQVPSGNFNGAPGYAGLAFLESPGNPYDGIDNDDDYTRTALATETPAQFSKAGIGSAGSDLNYDYDPASRTLNPETQRDQYFFRRTLKAGDPIILIDTVQKFIPRYSRSSTYYNRRFITVPNQDTTVVSLGRPFVIGANTVLTEVSNNLIDDNLNGIIDEDYDLHVNRTQSKTDPRRPNDPPELISRPSLHYVNYIALAQSGADLNNPLRYPMIDERRDDGLDNNGNNDPTDDLAIDAVDVLESDQIGLTSFALKNDNQFQVSANPADREQLYSDTKPGTFIFSLPAAQSGTDDYAYGTGYFPLAAGQTERFSLAVVFGQTAQEVLDNKSVAQDIYDANYTFARPPTTPTLQAVPDNGKITLYWDAVAEDYRDDFLRRRLKLPSTTTDPRVKNFEGYKIYRSSDNNFLDAFTVTGSQGQPAQQLKAIAQFDLIDSDSGNFIITNKKLANDVNGILYYLGGNTGLVHTYNDSGLVNGKTYFYGVVAYTRGSDSLGFYPSENSVSARPTPEGVYILSSNVVVAKPNAKVAGYTDPNSGGKVLAPLANRYGGIVPVGRGTARFIALDPKILANKTYQVDFTDTSTDTLDNDGDSLRDAADVSERLERTSAYRVIDVTNPAQPDTVVKRNRRPLDQAASYTTIGGKPTYTGDDDIFGGVYLQFDNELTVQYNAATSVWTRASGQEVINAYLPPVVKPLVFSQSDVSNVGGGVYVPLAHPDDYEIELITGTEQSAAVKIKRTSGSTFTYPSRTVNFRIKNITTGEPVRFFVGQNGTGQTNGLLDTNNVYIGLCESLTPPPDGTDTLFTYSITFQKNSALPKVRPVAGDKFTARTSKPFRTGDKLTFSTAPVFADNALANSQLSRVKVVPNPYIAKSVFEQALPPGQTLGRGERIINFTHVPRGATIRIYTTRGRLLQSLVH
ncbi:MAG: hypothetical protein IAF08_02415, partial [Rhizobacter sp.]|nr:hypothetical protein [Chlorobiales bacterium]